MKWQKVMFYPVALCFGFVVLVIAGAFQLMFSLLNLMVDGLGALIEWLELKDRG